MMSDTFFNKLKGKSVKNPDTGIDKKHEKTAVLKRKNIFERIRGE